MPNRHTHPIPPEVVEQIRLKTRELKSRFPSRGARSGATPEV